MRKAGVFVSLIVLATLVGLLATAGFAQEFRGRIQGIVTDSSQAVIPGASVTLASVSTQVKTVRQTSEAHLRQLVGMFLP